MLRRYPDQPFWAAQALRNLAGIRAFMDAFSGVPQVACFDTAYHAGAPALHQAFALPPALTAQGVRRYGFHGLSYQYIIGELLARSARARGRTLMAHLGNGASLCAARDGRSQATTMGFSALDGLMMGTRSGSIDPGVLLHLMDRGWDAARIEARSSRRMLARQDAWTNMIRLTAAGFGAGFAVAACALLAGALWYSSTPRPPKPSRPPPCDLAR